MTQLHIAVVGRGLIGSAAAKYLARTGARVTMIGPDEPADWAAHQGVFSSHYDEGRITRALDADPFWSRVSRASIPRYRDIEAVSGVRFFGEVGAAMAGPADGDIMTDVRAVADAAGIAAEWFDADGFSQRFPFLRLQPGDLAGYEATGAGHVSPRNLVRAQGICAEKAGATVLHDTVVGVDETGQGVTIRCENAEVRADHALIATGAFCHDLLGDLVADVIPYKRTVAFFRLGPAEQARLRGMPSLIHKTAEDAPYILPPIRYPDGAVYLKLGGDPVDLDARDPAALRDWYRSGGSAEVGEYLREVILRRIPDLDYEAMHVAACSTTFSPEDKPRIGPVSGRVTMAVAGCGRGAKCSDELGRMASHAVQTGAMAEVAA